MSDKVENQMSAEEFWQKHYADDNGDFPPSWAAYKFAEAYAAALASSRALKGVGGWVNELSRARAIFELGFRAAEKGENLQQALESNLPAPPKESTR